MREEIKTMRHKVASAHPVKPGYFDVKHSPGGMVDAEFAVQFLVLSSAAEHAELRANVGNIALLQRCEAVGLLGSGVGRAAADAYRSLRHAQHQARLNEESTQLAPATLQSERAAIETLWNAVLG